MSVQNISTQDAYNQWASVYDTDGNMLQAIDDLELEDVSVYESDVDEELLSDGGSDPGDDEQDPAQEEDDEEEEEWQREAAQQLAAEAEEEKERAKERAKEAELEAHKMREAIEAAIPQRVDLSIEEGKALFKVSFHDLLQLLH